jgi:hypothetical protein
MKFELVKTKRGFIPATEEDREKIGKIEHGEVVMCESSDARSKGHHRKFFAMIKLCWDNLPEQLDKHFPTPDDLRYELIRRAGFYTQYTDFKGNVVYRPESIRFDSMGQERFNDLYDRVLDVACKELYFDKEDMLNELQEFE